MRRHCRCRLSASQLGPLDLAAARLRQLGGELDDAGELVGGGLALAVLLQLAGQLLAGLTVAGHDDRPHDGAALWVWCGDRGGFGDVGVREQRRLDLEGADPVAGGEDDVVVAALEVEIAVLVGADQVPGRPPLAFEALAVEVAREEGGGGVDAELQLALDDPRSIPGRGLPIDPGRTGSSARLPLMWPVSVCP